MFVRSKQIYQRLVKYIFLLVIFNIIEIFCHCLRSKLRNVKKELPTLCCYTLLQHVDKLPKIFRVQIITQFLAAYGWDFISKSSSDRIKYNTSQRMYIQHRERARGQSSMWADGQLIQAKRNLITLWLKERPDNLKTLKNFCQLISSRIFHIINIVLQMLKQPCII